MSRKADRRPGTTFMAGVPPQPGRLDARRLLHPPAASVPATVREDRWQGTAGSGNGLII